MTPTSVAARNILLALCVASLTGCFLAGDERNAEVEGLMSLNHQTLTEQLSRLSDDHKAALLVSSWKRHPPSRFLNEGLRNGGLSLAQSLTQQVDAGDGYVVTVEMLDFLLEMRSANSLSAQDITHLDLANICRRNAPQEQICADRLNQLLK